MIRRWLSLAGAVLARPSLWWVALRQLWRSAPAGWWRRAPFLPVPRGAYLEFRLVTQYGDPNHRPEAHDVVNYLAWCKQVSR